MTPNSESALAVTQTVVRDALEAELTRRTSLHTRSQSLVQTGAALAALLIAATGLVRAELGEPLPHTVNAIAVAATLTLMVSVVAASLALLPTRVTIPGVAELRRLIDLSRSSEPPAPGAISDDLLEINFKALADIESVNDRAAKLLRTALWAEALGVILFLAAGSVLLIDV